MSAQDKADLYRCKSGTISSKNGPDSREKRAPMFGWYRWTVRVYGFLWLRFN